MVLGTSLGDPALAQAHLDIRWLNSGRCWSRSPWSRICSPRGWFSCIPRQSRRITSCVWWSPSQWQRMLGHMMMASGLVCERSCTSIPRRTKTSGVGPICRWCLAGVGLRSAARTSISAHCASWADCLPMMFARHPEVASRLARQLEGHPDSPS